MLTSCHELLPKANELSFSAAELSFYVMGSRRSATALPIDVAPMADANDENQYPVIAYVADDPVVTDSVLPVLAKLGATKRLTEAAGILTGRQPVPQEAKDPLSIWTIDPVQLARRRRQELNPPRHDAGSGRPVESSGRHGNA